MKTAVLILLANLFLGLTACASFDYDPDPEAVRAAGQALGQSLGQQAQPTQAQQINCRSFRSGNYTQTKCQ